MHDDLDGGSTTQGNRHGRHFHVENGSVQTQELLLRGVRRLVLFDREPRPRDHHRAEVWRHKAQHGLARDFLERSRTTQAQGGRIHVHDAAVRMDADRQG
jgi:hypothetical protein